MKFQVLIKLVSIVAWELPLRLYHVWYLNNSLGQKLTKLKRNTWFCQKWCLRAYFSHLLIILNGIFAVVGGPHRFQSASIVTFHRHALEFFTEAIMLPSAAAYPDCKTTLILPNLSIVLRMTTKHKFIPFYVWSPDWKMLQNCVFRLGHASLQGRMQDLT